MLALKTALYYARMVQTVSVKTCSPGRGFVERRENKDRTFYLASCLPSHKVPTQARSGWLEKSSAPGLHWSMFHVRSLIEADKMGTSDSVMKYMLGILCHADQEREIK